MTWIESFGTLLGRILIASYFLMSGVMKISNFENSLMMYQQQEIPFPGLVLYISTLLMMIGAIFVLLGYRTRLGAFLLILTLLPITFIFHNFWMHEENSLNVAFFFKDIAIAGGLLYVISRGSGLCSLDALRKRRKAKLITDKLTE